MQSAPTLKGPSRETEACVDIIDLATQMETALHSYWAASPTNERSFNCSNKSPRAVLTLVGAPATKYSELATYLITPL
jgi:hypothetical protein